MKLTYVFLIGFLIFGASCSSDKSSNLDDKLDLVTQKEKVQKDNLESPDMLADISLDSTGNPIKKEAEKLNKKEGKGKATSVKEIPNKEVTDREKTTTKKPETINKIKNPAAPKPKVKKPTTTKKTVKKEVKPVVVKEVVKAPKIKFERMSFDFGEIDQGDKIDYQFKFKNTGNAELIINTADVTCGCTVPSYPFIPIAPGETGYIGVTYNSVGKEGEQKPTVTVSTNAEPSIYKLTMKGSVKPKEG